MLMLSGRNTMNDIFEHKKQRSYGTGFYAVYSMTFINY